MPEEMQYARRQSPEKKSFDMRETIESAGVLLRRQFARNRHELPIQLPEFPCMIYGDPNQLWQILINLLLNADQAMSQEGSIKVILRPENIQIVKDDEKKIRTGGGRYILTVTDTGIGMTSEQLENTFKPFFTTKASGTGLGLAIVKRIVDENEWQIDIESKPAQGTTIKLMMPGEAQ